MDGVGEAGRRAVIGVIMGACLLLAAGSVILIHGPPSSDGPVEMGSTEPPLDADLIVSGEMVTDPTGVTAHVANDFTSALQWAVSQTGQAVRIPAGAYAIDDTIRPANGVVLFGDGDGEDGTVLEFVSGKPSEARIQISSGVNDVTLAQFRITGNASIEIRSSGVTCGGHLLRDITAYRTSAIQAAAFEMLVLNKGVLDDIQFIRCKAIETDHIGFFAEGDGYRAPGGVQNTPAFSGWIKNLYFEDCLADHCGYDGRYNAWVVGFDLAESVNVENVKCVRCTAQYCWESGFHFEPSPTVINAVLEDCVASYNGQKPDDYWNGDGTRGLWFGMGFYWAPSKTRVTLLNCVGEGNRRGLTPG